MLAEIGAAFATLYLAVWALAAHPTRAQCPKGWFVNGVRPNGAYACLRDRDPSLDEHAPSAGHDEIDGRITCLPTFMPLVRDERSVWCSTIP